MEKSDVVRFAVLPEGSSIVQSVYIFHGPQDLVKTVYYDTAF